MALVITIVILIILAGIAISQLTGSGLLNKTLEAKEENDKQTATETINFKITNIQISSYAENKELPTLQYLADKLCEDDDMEYVTLASKTTASLDKIDVSNVSSIYTKLKDYSYEFEINNDLQLESIDGIKIASSNTNTSTGNPTGNVSTIINDFEIKLDGNISGKKVPLNIVSEVETTDNSKIAGYVIVVNGIATQVTNTFPCTIELAPNSNNIIYVVALDKDINLKKSSNSLEVSVPNIEITPLAYPKLNTTGWVNCTYKNLETNEVTEELDYSVQCTASDALDVKAYDGDTTTYYDGTSSKKKFYFGSNVDCWQICFKADDFSRAFTNLSQKGYVEFGDVQLLDNGFYHFTWWGKRTAWANNFVEASCKIYEIYYDGNIP